MHSLDAAVSTDDFLPLGKADSQHIRICPLLAAFAPPHRMNDEVLHGKIRSV